MSESISQKFITAIGPARDRLYADARLRAGLHRNKTSPGAEGLLRQAIDVIFARYAASTLGPPTPDTLPDIPAAVSTELDNLEPRRAPGGEEIGESTEPEPMPAEVWARLTAAVQIAAAKLPGGPALNPDSVLLSPDPLLAPKKSPPRDEPMDGLNLSPTSRFALASVLALLLGIAVTIYLTTRGIPKRLAEPTETATTPAR